MKGRGASCLSYGKFQTTQREAEVLDCFFTSFDNMIIAGWEVLLLSLSQHGRKEGGRKGRHRLGGGGTSMIQDNLTCQETID